LGGMRTSQLADKYIVKRNKIRNQCALMKNPGEEGVQHYLDKLAEMMTACDKLLRTWITHGSPLGDRKVKETMYQTISKTADELEQSRDNTSTEDTLTSLTQIETSLDEIRKMDTDILRGEEDDATEFPSLLKILTKKTGIFENNAHFRKWWYEVMSGRPPSLSKRKENYREGILDRIEEGWQDEEWAINIPRIVNEILRRNLFTTKTSRVNRTDPAADGIQWIRMEELGQAFTNRCRAVRKMKEKRRKTQRGTRDRHTNSEQLQFECQLTTPTRSRVQELLNLGTSSPHKLFQSLIINQDLLPLWEDMWPNHRVLRKGW